MRRCWWVWKRNAIHKEKSNIAEIRRKWQTYYIKLFLVPWLSIYAIHQLVGYWLRISSINIKQSAADAATAAVFRILFMIFFQRCSCHCCPPPPSLQGSMKIQISRWKPRYFILSCPLPMMSACQAGPPTYDFYANPTYWIQLLPSLSLRRSVQFKRIHYFLLSQGLSFYHLENKHLELWKWHGNVLSTPITLLTRIYPL